MPSNECDLIGAFTLGASVIFLLLSELAGIECK